MKALIKFLGIEPNTTSHSEKWVSALGGFLGIVLTLIICRYSLGADNYILVASLGASAVLVFALPHVSVSQPWSLVGGQAVSAIVGVSSAKLFPDTTVIAAAAAVAGAILLMYYLRCVHPPGGATALAAIIGGPNIHELGFQFVLAPILLNALVLMVLAIAINYMFTWRRYPVYLSSRAGYETKDVEAATSMFATEDLQQAMKQLDLYIDVREEDLTQLVNLAINNYKKNHLLPSEIRLGRYYSNGKLDDEQEIRLVVDESSHHDANKDMVIFKLAGAQKQSTSSDVVTRVQFAKWARYEVRNNDGVWKKVE